MGNMHVCMARRDTEPIWYYQSAPSDQGWSWTPTPPPPPATERSRSAVLFQPDLGSPGSSTPGALQLSIPTSPAVTRGEGKKGPLSRHSRTFRSKTTVFLYFW